MNNYSNLLAEAQKTLQAHNALHIRLKRKPVNAFGSLYIAKFIENKKYPNYELYIHKHYFTLKSMDLKNFGDVKFPIDDKLWIEFYMAFDFIEIIEKDCEE